MVAEFVNQEQMLNGIFGSADKGYETSLLVLAKMSKDLQEAIKLLGRAITLGSNKASQMLWQISFSQIGRISEVQRVEVLLPFYVVGMATQQKAETFSNWRQVFEGNSAATALCAAAESSKHLKQLKDLKVVTPEREDSLEVGYWNLSISRVQSLAAAGMIESIFELSCRLQEQRATVLLCLAAYLGHPLAQRICIKKRIFLGKPKPPIGCKFFTTHARSILSPA
jgi:hypothetical protein